MEESNVNTRKKAASTLKRRIKVGFVKGKGALYDSNE